MAYVQAWNGAQPGDPSATPVGSAEFASIANAPTVLGKMSAAGGGVTQLGSPASPNTPAGAAALSGITFVRVYDGSSLPLIDTTASLAGGGGGAILDSLTSNAGVGNVLQAFSLKMPNALNTLMLSQSLADRLVDVWANSGNTAPQMGINTGGGSTITLYGGTVPSSADAAAGTALATYSMGATNLWGAAAGGAVSLAAAGPTATASATGTATYFRMVKTLGAFTFTFQGTVGTVSGASDMILNTVALTSGVTSVQITDFTISI